MVGGFISIVNMEEENISQVPKEDHWISLLSGGQYHYHDPDKSNVTLEDIATSLSNICRFSGHPPRS